jgi:structure-specific recognition protein 1
MSSEDEDSMMSEEEEVIAAPAKKTKAKPSKAAAASKKKPAKKKKDPNAPKRPMNAFFLYSNANRARIKEENPDAKFTEIPGIASAEFKSLSDKEAGKWQKAAAEDKARYQAEMEDYEPPEDDDEGEDDDDDDSPPPKKTKAAAKKGKAKK